MAPFLENEQSLIQFLADFETGSLPRSEWTHAAHVSVGGCFSLAYDPDEALLRIRTGIQRYNASQGIANTPTSGYHETLTCFWAAIIQQCLQLCDPQLPRVDKIRFVVSELGDKRDLHRHYYAFNVVASREARARWIPPDRTLLIYPLTAHE